MNATLPNTWRVCKSSTGLTVAVRPMPNSVVTIDVWVATGSAREEQTTYGISHFLEHMLFKGTSRFGVGELDRHIMNLGGVWNAGTSMDFTHYYVTVGAPYFNQALDAIADMIQHASIDEQEFEKERLVILEEYRRKQDDPWGWLFDELYQLTFTKGPYRHPVIGTLDSISNLSRQTLVDYYRRTYTADSISVVVAGDIEPDAACEQIQNYFCDLCRAKHPWPWPSQDTEFARGIVQKVARDVHEVYLGLALPAPSVSELRDVVALDLLSVILGAGRSSRLTQRLREQLGLVEEVGLSVSTHRAPGITYAYAILQEKNLDHTIAEMTQMLQGVAASPPTDEELAKAKRIVRNDLYYSTETTSGQTSLYGYYLTLTGSDEFYHRYLPLVQEITISELLAAAEKYLNAQEPVVLAEIPSHSTPSEVSDARC